MTGLDVSAYVKSLAQRLKELEADLAYLSLKFQLVAWTEEDKEELQEIVNEIEARHEELDWLLWEANGRVFLVDD
jgi:lipid II:glycine glycyltransferase (peptidoglycan interpeptide bridge formation enzyme)